MIGVGRDDHAVPGDQFPLLAARFRAKPARFDVADLAMWMLVHVSGGTRFKP